jgi:hypothetical protein
LRLGAGTPTQPNAQVLQAQQQLQALGFDVGTDGVFGKDTQRAIQRLQMMTGLKVDGILGPATLQMLQLQAQRLQQEDQEMFGTSPNGKAATKTRRARTLHARTSGGGECPERGRSQPYGGGDGGVGSDGSGRVPRSGRRDDTRGLVRRTLRESAHGSWEACLNCVHFNTKERCLLHAYPVDMDDLCDNHLSLTPQEQRHWGGYMEAFRDVVEARAAGDGSALARAEARRDYHVSKLEEIGTRQKERVMNEAKRPGSKSQDDRAKRSVGGSAGRTGGDSNGHRHAVNLLRGKRQDPRDGAKQITEVKSSAYPGLDRSPKKNWVDKAGGLPKYIERIAKHLHYEKGMDIGHAIAMAVNVVKKMCAAGDTNFPGKQNVNAGSRAEACAAVKQWESKKLRHGVMREAASKLEREPIPKSTVGLGFAVRTVREVQEIDRAIAEGSYTPEF